MINYSKSLLSAVAICVGMGVAAQVNAASYYNCNTAQGCVPVKNIKQTSNYNQTRYPIVLAHGLGGWNRLFNMVEYFNGIPKSLTQHGAKVYATKVASVNNSEVRGEQLLRQVNIITAITGSPKVNLIGHSQGGIDVRYVAAVAPEKVASVTAVASPAQGSKMADWVLDTTTKGTGKAENINLGGQMAIKFFDTVSKLMDIGSGLPKNQLHTSNGWQATQQLSTKGMAAFNQKFPYAMPNQYCGYPRQTSANGVKYYSFSGVGTFTNGIDPSDYVLSITGLSMGKEQHDGLVSRCSSRVGQVIRDDYRMNHLDSVNLLLGMTAIGEVNTVAVYRKHVNFLKSAGH